MKARSKKVEFEVHERKVGATKTDRVAGGASRIVAEQFAHDAAAEYNADEAERARMELRKVRTEYVVVRATTKYELIE